MLEAILDNKIKEKVLLSLFIRKESYARELAAIFKQNLFPIQNQLKKLERGGVLISRLKGRTRLYALNPNYVFSKELSQLLAKAVAFIPAKEKQQYYTPRLRPRRTGKPL